MKKIFIFLLIAFVSVIFAENVIWETDGQGRLTGKIVKIQGGQTVATEIVQEKVNVNPYMEEIKTYNNVKKIYIWHGGIDIRIGLNDTTTADTDNYNIISKNGMGYLIDDVYMETMILHLRGDTETDTGVARIDIYK